MLPRKLLGPILLILTTLISVSLHADHSRDLIRVYTPDRSSLNQVLSHHLDIAYSRPGGYVEILADEDDIITIRSLGLTFETVTRDVGRVEANRNRASLAAHPAFGEGSMGGFYTYDETIAAIDSMRVNDPHGIVSEIDTLGWGHREKKPIVRFKISDNPDVNEDEPEVFYNSLHHAREPMGVMSLIYYIEYLLANYGTDAEVTYLVDNREMTFIPFVNPDGYAINESIYFHHGEFGYWRKNARDNNSNGEIDDGDGVDLNRNYGYQWGYDDYGSSPYPSDPTYRGPGPFSEPETGIIRMLSWDHQFLFALNYHSHSDLMIYPWGFNDEETPDSLFYRELAENVTEFNNYQYGTGMETVNYVTNGNADDWMYGEQGEKPKIFSMTPEVGHSYDGFYPPPERILPLAEENLQGNLYIARVGGGYLMKDGNAVVSEVSGDGDDFPDPGETVDLTLAVRNNGLTTTLESITGNLVTGNLMIEVVEPAGGFGTIAPLAGGSNAGDTWQITLDDSIIPGERVRFYVDFTADGGYASRDSFEVIVGTPETIFFDDAESGMANFTSTDWDIDIRYARSGYASFSDSPTGDYSSSALTSMTLRNGIDLSNPGISYLTYYARWFIEKDWDIAKVQLSRDGMAWETLDGTNTFPGSGFEYYHNTNEEGYHSNQLFFKKETIDLTDYTGPGNENVLFRFTLQSDNWVEFDGIYIDDIEVIYFDPEGSVGIGDEGDGTPALPRALTLSQNYPNPFNPMTTIDVEIPETTEGRTTLRIFDLRGKLVRTLVDRELTAGNYRFTWDGKTDRDEGVSSGVYLYTLKQENRTITRKMTLVR